MTTSSSPFAALASAFELLTRPPGGPVLNGRRVGAGLAARPVAARELATVLPTLDPAGRDAVWSELVRLTRTGSPAWTVVAGGLALPGLRTASARVTRGYAGDTHDLQGDMLCAFLQALREIDPTRGAICGRLRAAAQRAGMRTRYARDRDAARTVTDSDGLAASRAPRPPFGHPDIVLFDAVERGVITADEANLIGSTRLEKMSLRSISAHLGIPRSTAGWRRARAEARLVNYLRERIDAGPVGRTPSDFSISE